MRKSVLTLLTMYFISSTVIVSAADINLDNFQQRIDSILAKYGPYMSVAQNTLDKQTIRQIISGQVNIPDEAINRVITENLYKQDQVTALTVKSKKNGRLDIHADTIKYGGIDMSGTIDAFVHTKDNSFITYTVKDKDLEKYGGIKGWMFAHLSVSMLEKFFGSKVEFGDDVVTEVHGNKVTIDYKTLLAKSSVADVEVAGYKLIDVIQIDSAIPREGYVEVHTSLNVPEYVKSILASMIQ